MSTNMTFTDFVTPVPADWLNYVNTVVNNPAVVNTNLVVSSITALRGVSKLTNSSAQVTGYYTPADGGGGFYQLHPSDSTSADDGGSIIVATDGGRWFLQYNDTLSVKQFGARGDGSTDDTAAMGAAHATGHLIYYPASTYIFSTISFSKGGIVGEGIGQTILQSNDTTTANLITYTGFVFSTGTPLFRDFLIKVPTNTSKSTGAAFLFAPSPATGNEVQYSNFSNIFIINIPSGISFTAASKFVLDNVKIYDYSVNGVLIDNTNVADSGDSFISNCFFSTTISTGIAVLQHASGGLKITNTKMLGGADGYILAFNGNMTTGDLLISNTSIENMTGFGIFLSRTGGTNTFGAIVFSNLQIAFCGGTGVGGSGCIGSDSSGAFSQITITGCNLAVANGTGSGINFPSGSIINIGGCNIIGNGGTPVGIIIGAAVTNGIIYYIVYSNLSTNITNGSGTVVVH